MWCMHVKYLFLLETALRLKYIKHERKELGLWNCYLKNKFEI